VRFVFSLDTRRILLAQAVRAFGYGFAAVLLGVSLDRRGFSSVEAGVVLAAVVAGTVAAQLVIGRYADRWGRRGCYAGLYVVLAVAGVVFAAAAPWWALAMIALSGALSTEVVESGPFTTLEQAMLARESSGNELTRGFGFYNAVAAAAGSLGALAAAVPTLVGDRWNGVPSEERWFLVLVATGSAGVAIAMRLSDAVEPDVSMSDATATSASGRLGASRPAVVRLAGLFALDSFGGGFVVQAFIAYWLSARFDASVEVVALVFFVVGLLQTASFLVAPRIAERWGLLRTMVFTHLPSNVLLAAMAFAPTLQIAVALLWARVVLSQMDVPTRQAYVMGLVQPDERTAAAAYTNTARYVVRPIGPVVGGALQSVALGLPFVMAGTVKSIYDVVLWRWFRKVELPTDSDDDHATDGSLAADRA
jgi:MFS family permease